MLPHRAPKIAHDMLITNCYGIGGLRAKSRLLRLPVLQIHVTLIGAGRFVAAHGIG